MNPMEFSQYIDIVTQKATELGVKLSVPAGDLYLKYLQYIQMGAVINTSSLIVSVVSAGLICKCIHKSSMKIESSYDRGFVEFISWVLFPFLVLMGGTILPSLLQNVVCIFQPEYCVIQSIMGMI